MPSQPMRSKQLLMSHGPGSILETVNGPVVIKGFSSLTGTLGGLENRGIRFPDHFRINEPRLASLLPGEGQVTPQIHSIPSNADLAWPMGRYIVDSNPFPNWLICQSSNHRDGVLYHAQRNPECPHPNCQERGNPVRFVSYCKAGHLSDVSWRRALHEGPPGCAGEYINWRETDSSMTGIMLSCSDPACNASRSLREISNGNHRCSGFHPERWQLGQQGLQVDCQEPPRVVPRQSSILWQPILQTVITVPKEETMKKLVSELFIDMIRGGRRVEELQERAHSDPLEDLFEEQRMSGLSQPDDEDTAKLLAYIWDDFGFHNPIKRRKIIHLCSLILTEGIDEFRGHWDSLRTGREIDTTRSSFRMEHASLSSFPMEGDGPMEDRDPGTRRLIFRMEDRSFSGGFGSLMIEAREVPLVRTVSALTGYTRGASEVGEDQPQMVPLGYQIHDTEWYAAMEEFGEGVVLKLSDESQSLHEGERYQEWSKFHEKMVEKSLQNEPDEHIPWMLYRSAGSARRIDEDWLPPSETAGEYFSEAHPSFVWWHTFAHHLIRSIQADTGYSSASIRERVYSVPNQSGVWEGAILLYVTDGMDGTLGGLTSILPNLQTFLDGAERTALLCSNDPLCEEGTASKMPQRGCYACTLNPETSCEHRNMFLDRLLLVEGADL